MNKIIVLILSAMLLVSPAYAQPEEEVSVIGNVETANENMDNALNLSKTPLKGIMDKVPPMKNAILLDFDGDMDYGSLFTLLKWKGLMLDAGYSPKDALVFGASYEITRLENWGVEIPILKEVKLEPGVFYGFERIENEDLRNSSERTGVYFSILDLRFY